MLADRYVDFLRIFTLGWQRI